MSQRPKLYLTDVEALKRFQKKYAPNARQDIQIIRKSASMDKPESITPEKLPDIWPVDTEYLLKELARIRELALRVPFNTTAPLDLHAPINSVIDAVWHLEQLIGFCLGTQRAMQRSFAQKAPPKAPSTTNKKQPLKQRASA